MGNKTEVTWSYGGVVRGRRDRRELALIFTGGDFGEGSGFILDTLRSAEVSGSFFFTGGYLQEPGHHEIVRRAVTEKHYVGPHSHRHLLYCPWEDRQKTVVTQEQFAADLHHNIGQLVALGVSRGEINWWIPPFEWFNEDIARWSREEGYPVFSFTPGTLSHADYTEERAANYRSSQSIFDSIFTLEKNAPDGLNGFLLLFHLGAGEGRADKFFLRLPSVISRLLRRGYRFRRVDELLTNVV